jgi:signal transduction histidine kinase
MSLAWKFFGSYLVVVAIGLLVLAVSTAFVAPAAFSAQMEHMSSMGEGMGHNHMMGGAAANQATLQTIDQELKANFRKAVNSALLKAGIAAILAAGAVSWLVSQQVTRPLRQVAAASHHIAEGHFEQRIPQRRKDELGELIGSFNHMAARLAETETMRQQLIADVSHELKTPLASIKGYMEGLQDGVIAATPETFEIIHHEADRLQRLVYDLQELSRVEAGAFHLDRHPADLGPVVSAVAARLSPQYADKNVTLVSDPPSALPKVLADQDRVEQVLTNLLGNALQYTPTGGCVKVSLTPIDSMLRVSVQDTGLGLTSEDLTRIFQRFYRVDKSRSRRSGGSGIGLTIARHLVEAHGGQIWVESPGPGQGSTFYFMLPLA